MSDAEIIDGLLGRGLQEPQTEAERDLIVEVVRSLDRPRFCGVPEHINIGGARYGTWPETTLRYCIQGTHPSMAPVAWKRCVENALDEYHSRFVLDFVETSDPSEGHCHLLFTIANLGGPGGVLAQAGLVPYGLAKNDDFRSRIESDKGDNFVEDLTGAVLEILAVEVLKHEGAHSMGAPHHSVPNSLLNPTYNPRIRGLQPGDIDLLVKLGLRLRPKAAPTPPQPSPGEPALGRVDYRRLTTGVAYTPKKRAWVLEEL